MSMYAAILGGAMGSTVFSILMQPFSSVLRIPTVGAYLGTMFTAGFHMALGYFLQLIGGAFLGLIYSLLWRAGVGRPTIFWGVVFGAVQWLALGPLFALLPFVHTGVQAGTLPAPGPYMVNVGGFGAFIALLISNIMFGLTVAAIYYGFITHSSPVRSGKQ